MSKRPQTIQDLLDKQEYYEALQMYRALYRTKLKKKIEEALFLVDDGVKCLIKNPNV
jgi:flagellar biosynthesis regulator FlbT